MTRFPPKQSPEELKARMDRDAVRDVESAYINVRIALRGDDLPRETRSVLVTARDQLGWSSKQLGGYE